MGRYGDTLKGKSGTWKKIKKDRDPLGLGLYDIYLNSRTGEKHTLSYLLTMHEVAEKRYSPPRYVDRSREHLF